MATVGGTDVEDNCSYKLNKLANYPVKALLTYESNLNVRYQVRVSRIHEIVKSNRLIMTLLAQSARHSIFGETTESTLIKWTKTLYER